MATNRGEWHFCHDSGKSLKLYMILLGTSWQMLPQNKIIIIICCSYEPAKWANDVSTHYLCRILSGCTLTYTAWHSPLLHSSAISTSSNSILAMRFVYWRSFFLLCLREIIMMATIRIKQVMRRNPTTPATTPIMRPMFVLGLDDSISLSDRVMSIFIPNDIWLKIN